MRPVIRDFFTGFGNIFRKSRTVVFPKEKIIIPENSRGIPKLKLDLDSLEVLCNGCGKCKIACTENCIEIRRATDEKGQGALEEFYLDLTGCILCGNCIDACDRNAIEMTYKHMLADPDRASLKLDKLDLIKQADYSIRDFWGK